MLKKITDKLRSERGASLSMALLLFVVCAVVGGVILAAATVTSGRLSQLAEMDQKYYNVTSAAQILADELGGEEVTIIREEEKSVPYINESEDGVEGKEDTDHATYSYSTKFLIGDVQDGNTISGKSSIPSNLKLLSKLAAILMFGSDNINTAEAMQYSFDDGKGNSASETEQKKLEVTFSDNGEHPLKAEGEYVVDDSGIVMITITSGTDAPYSAVLSLTPAIEDEVIESEVTEDGVNRIYKTKKISTIKWTVAGIQ